MPGDVAENERGSVEPRDAAERREVRDDAEVAVALLPVRHPVARDRVHLHVEREQVVAALHTLVGRLLEEVLALDALPHEPPLHVGEGGDDGVDRALLDLVPEPLEREHAPDGPRPTGTRRGGLSLSGFDSHGLFIPPPARLGKAMACSPDLRKTCAPCSRP